MSLLEIPISDAGFRHGVGVFETVLVKSGKARWRDWHLESIHRSAKALGLKVEEKEFKQVPQGDGLWRWFVTDTGTRSWWCEGLEKVSPTVSLEMGKVGVWSDSWEARYKTMSYLSRIQARAEVSSARSGHSGCCSVVRARHDEGVQPSTAKVRTGVEALIVGRSEGMRSFGMRATGLEPARELPHQNLNLMRLPISPRPRGD